LDGAATLLVFLAGILSIVALTTRARAHPFLSMYFVAVTRWWPLWDPSQSGLYSLYRCL